MSYRDKAATLTIEDVSSQDIAKYRCEASNNLGLVETSAQLEVQGKNIFTFTSIGLPNFE